MPETHDPPTEFDGCPADPEAMAESYVMGTLHGTNLAAFEDHYLTCAGCASAVEAAEQYATAMRAAACRLRKPPN
jgi:hypothetical protein